MSDSLQLVGLLHARLLCLGFSRQEYWSGLPFSSPRDLPKPGTEPMSSESLALTDGLFDTELPGNPRERFSSVQLLSHVQLFVTLWTAACQATLSITSSWSLLKLMSIESVMPSNHLIIYHPLLLLPSIFPSIRVFSNESALHIRGQSTGVSASASALPMNIQC